MTKDGPPTPTTNRRRTLALLGGAAVAGLGGCLGDNSSGSNPGAESTPTADSPSGSTPAPDSTPESNAAPDPENDDPEYDLISREEFDCGSMSDSMVRENAADRPFVFTYERPEGWIREELDSPTQYIDRVNAPVEVETGGFLYAVAVEQYYEPVAESALEDNRDDHWEDVGTLSFGGETRTVVNTGSGDMGRTILAVVVPNPGTDEYHRVSVDASTLAFDEPECFDHLRELALAVVQSLQPKG